MSSSNPFGGTPYAFGSSSNPFTVKVKAAKVHHAGGILDNLANDIEGTVTGFIPGLIQTAMHPIQAGEAIGHDFRTRYGPLLGYLNGGGNIHKFFHEIDQHPLSFLLDAATIATGGAGGLAKLGVLSDEAGQLLVRSPGAISEGLSPAEAAARDAVETIPTSHNPLTRSRQNFTHNMLGKVPGELGHMIETARYTNRVFKHTVANKAMHLLGSAGLVDRLAQAGSKLTENELIAHNLRGPMTPPDLLVPHLLKARDEIVKQTQVPMEGLSGPDLKAAQAQKAAAHEELARINHQIVMVQRPEVNKLFFKPSQAMQDFRGLVKQAGDIDAHIRGIDPAVRENARWAKLSHLVLPHEGEGTALVKPEEAGSRVADLRQYLHSRGIHDEPIYIPDAHVEGGSAGRMAANGPLNVPKAQVFKNKHLLFDAGRIAYNAETMTPQLTRSLMHAHALDLLDQVRAAGRKVTAEDIGKWERKGWMVVRDTEGHYENGRWVRGHNPDFITRNKTRFLEDLESAGSDQSKMADVFHNFIRGETTPDATGHYTVVPRKFVDKLTNQFTANNVYLKNLWDKPATIWKTIMLGLRPAFAGNLVVGNTLMYALHFAGLNGLKGIVHAVGHTPGGDAALKKLLSPLGLGGAREGATFLKHFPEMVHSGFANSQVPFMRGARESSTLRKVGKRAAQGVFPQVAKVERSMRVAAMEAAARNAPEVAAELRKVEAAVKAGRLTLPRGKTALHEAMDRAFDKHKGLRDHIAGQINNALGNYHAFTRTERSVQRLSPFYAFYKHVAKSGADLALNHPIKTNAALTVGQVGHDSNAKELGNVPAFLGTIVPIGHKGADTHLDGILSTSFNPYVTADDLGKGAAALIEGKPTNAARDVGSFLHPFLTAGIEQATGKSLLTGSNVKQGLNKDQGGLIGGMLGSVIGNLPQAQLAGIVQDALSGSNANQVQLTPSGRVKKHKAPLYQHDWQQLLLSYLGLPYRNVNLTTAQGMGG